MGRSRHDGQRHLVNAASLGSCDPLDFVAERLVERYSHPSRTAYLYCFRLQPGTDFAPLIPDLAAVIIAWVDEGAGLAVLPADAAISRCQTALVSQSALALKPARPTTSHERRQTMARLISFSIERQAVDQISVDLFSRALAFTPKGDRRVTETWRPAEGTWYSAPIGRE